MNKEQRKIFAEGMKQGTKLVLKFSVPFAVAIYAVLFGIYGFIPKVFRRDA